MLINVLRARRGVTLLELMVTLVVGGLALSLIAAVSVRQQRITADITDRAALTSQLGDAAAILPVDLRSVSSAAGDIRDARDTSLEIRETIATAVVCDTSALGIILAPASSQVDTHASFLNPIAVGDTAWVLSPDELADWHPYRVDDVNNAPAGACSARGPAISTEALTRTRVALRLDSAAGVGAGVPLRVTRPLRYSIYRGSDGQWYLGQRDWNTANLRFNTVQPVAGPLLPPPSGLIFKYVDTVGSAVATPVADTRALAMIRIELRGWTRGVARASARSTQRTIDSAGVWVFLRNHR